VVLREDPSGPDAIASFTSGLTARRGNPRSGRSRSLFGGFIGRPSPVSIDRSQDLDSGSILRSLLRLLPQRKPPAWPADKPLCAETLEDWLVARLAAVLGTPEADIDIHTPFASYGLDSLAAIKLSGELERLLGRRLSPTLAWDYPTIADLARFLALGEQTDPGAGLGSDAEVSDEG
jgi:acyl carrier protein